MWMSLTHNLLGDHDQVNDIQVPCLLTPESVMSDSLMEVSYHIRIQLQG